MGYTKTKKNKINRHNTTKKIAKKCVSDDEMGKICSTGQYSTYEGNFYTNKDNLEKFKLIKEKFKKDVKFKNLKTHKER